MKQIYAKKFLGKYPVTYSHSTVYVTKGMPEVSFLHLVVMHSYYVPDSRALGDWGMWERLWSQDDFVNSISVTANCPLSGQSGTNASYHASWQTVLSSQEVKDYSLAVFLIFLPIR